MAQSKRHTYSRVSWGGGKLIYKLPAMLLDNIVMYLNAICCNEKYIYFYTEI